MPCPDVLRPEHCRFTSPWLGDEADVAAEAELGLVDIAAEANTEILRNLGLLLASVAGVGAAAAWALCGGTSRKLKKS